MARRSTIGSRASNAKGRRVTPLKGRKATKSKDGKVKRNYPSISELQEELERCTNELNEALQQQAAAADVLKVIGRSKFDLATVLRTLVESAVRLCDADKAIITRQQDGVFFRAETWGFSDEYMDYVRNLPVTLDRGSATGRALLEGVVVHIPDVLADPDFTFVEGQRLGHFRTNLGVPMLRDGVPIGVFALTRSEVRPFTEKQIEIVKTFADQAAIAIENVRLFNETQEALGRQTATAEILKAIAASPADVQPVFNTIAANALRLCNAHWSGVLLYNGGTIELAAVHNLSDSEDAEALRRAFPRKPSGTGVTDRAIATKVTCYIPDVAEVPGYEHSTLVQFSRSVLSVPMLRDGQALGAITVVSGAPNAFTERQKELLGTFADQAVIAIQNARQFNDTKEALERQTATANVLKVISRSAFDLQSVLDTLVESATHLCVVNHGVIFLRDGEVLRLRASYGFPSETLEFARANPMKLSRESATGRVALDGRPVHIKDVLADPEYGATDYQRTFGYRTVLSVPLLREGSTIGVFALTSDVVKPFSDKQIELATTFADQAVIAIENVRLFDEVQAKTRDLEESLQQQTATADVLKVISRSAFDLQSVLQTLAESAASLFSTDMVNIWLRDGDVLRVRAHTGMSEEFHKFLLERPAMPERGRFVGRAFLMREIVHLPDVLADPEYTFADAPQRGGFRAVLGVPMVREDHVEGVFGLARSTPGPFTAREIDIVRTFADQALIAIGNARLFEELQARTRELSKSLDDLRTAQDRLVQTEKLASLGQLTAGIAHEIKNPLNFVNNFSALSAELTDELNDVLKPVTLDGEVREEIDELTGLLKDNLEKVVQHGKRADSIVKNMLLHSREGSGERRSADVNALVEDSLNLAWHGARAEHSDFSIALQRDLDPSTGMADLYPQEITRALLNLISNGFYAATKRAAEAGGGFAPALVAATKSLGDKVEIRIRDNGTGIPDGIKDKIFNPFFTTKPTGEGTGLGLSMSHDIIVKQHGGSIDVETEPGLFTEFKIVLPRTNQT